MSGHWNDEEIEFIRKHYPQKGQKWTAESLGRSNAAVRQKASNLGLRIDKKSEFFADFQKRAAESKIGKKRPDQALVMKSIHESGKLKKTAEQIEAMSKRSKEWIKENGHPRGALGMVHTPETKARMSESSKAIWAQKTEDQIAERNKKMMATKEKNGTVAQPRNGCSWKAAWHEIGGVRKYYRSKWESNYARYLEWLKRAGHITEWQHEPKTFWFDGIKRGCVSYLPDFRVVEIDGKEAFHEVKGWMDDRSKTKIKRMAKYHPDVKLIVIDARAYRALSAKVASLVPGWES